MKRVISLSAIVSGLLAAGGGPGFAAPASNMVRRADDAAGMVAPAQSMSAETAAKLQAQLVEMVEKGPEDVGGMRAMQRAVSEEMREHLNDVLAAEGLKRPKDGLEDVQGDFPESKYPDMPPARPIQWDPSGKVVSELQGTLHGIEKAAFLGVTTSQVHGALREQLGLQRGFGLVVDFVGKDSPAESAGLKVHDVLTKLDDQLLINVEQLAVLVRSKKPGDDVTLTVIRGGKETKLTAKLVEKELPVLEEFGGGMRWQGAMPMPPGNGLVQHNPLARPEDSSTWRTETRKLVDGEHDITVTHERGDTAWTVVVKDSAGKEVYHGPFASDADRAKVTPDLAKKIDRLMQAQNAVTVTGGVITGDEIRATRTDLEHEISLSMNRQGKRVVIKDVKTGKVIYDDAGDDADLAKLPPGVAEKVRAMQAKVEVRK